MLRYLTAGESHGKAIAAILEGMPAGLKVNVEIINRELKRRQSGFGRGKRMQIEEDKAEIVSGLKKGVTLGSPIALLVHNKDFSIEKLSKVISPRPGHADLAGLLKYGFSDIRNVLERASARSTVATVGVGALCKIFLSEFGIKIDSKVVSIGGETSKEVMEAKVLEAIHNKDTVGGIFELNATGVPVGLGSYAHADRRLDARLAQGIMSIPGIKAVEIGLGFGFAEKFGSNCHDAIYYNNKSKRYFRKTNNAGGIEGGISNGQDLVIRACMKPISTLINPLDSVNIITKKPSKAAIQRTDTCVVEAAGVVAESAAAFVLADSLLEKFGGDCMADINMNLRAYLNRLR